MSVAIYSANFGNYRGELNKGIDITGLDTTIDYYFFTDNKDIKSNQWNIIYIEKKETLDFIDSNRHSAIYIKYCIPEVLHKYEYIIWIDTKSLYVLPILSIRIKDIFKNNNKNIFFVRHPRPVLSSRSGAHEEVFLTSLFKNENIKNGMKFFEKIQNLKFNTYLPDTTCILLKNSPEVIKIFNDVYVNLIYYKLKRCQSVINYTLFQNNFEEYVDYYKFSDIQIKDSKNNDLPMFKFDEIEKHEQVILKLLAQSSI